MNLRIYTKLKTMPMTPARPKFHKSLRLETFDYSQPGAYFVTIVTHQRKPLFGNLANGLMNLSPLGELASSVWLGLPNRFAEVETDEFIVMPDHFHGILIIKEEGPRFNTSFSAPNPSRLSLSTLVGTYKSIVTRVHHFNNHTNKEPIWQRNYYEHIIRDELEFDQIRNYILENPARWEMDEKPSKWG
ncbi:transposase [bacterium]|nr:transposase [bacterium]